MISVDVKVVKDEATPALARLFYMTRNPQAMLKVLGRTAVRELTRHFNAKDTAEPNRLGGKRTHFWNDVADSVGQPAISSHAATVTIAHPAYSHKLTGGKISAKKAGSLTIPLIPEAHGRYASVFEGATGSKLFLYKAKSGKKNTFLARSEGNGLELVYLLAKSVNQNPDKTAFPDEGTLSTAIQQQAEAFIQRELNRRNAA